ncbi:MAG TPA: crossover junction endodeoxyribonuclease RuvC [Acidimicrobiales bacterium]|nr:crossover junction endodeoxyribonuclease RuvC [Acidimicrobiales bacterium]
MFVLGIDPGLSRCGYGCLARAERGDPFRTIAAGVLTTPTSEPVPTRLAMLRADLVSLLDELRPDVMVIERIFFRSNARTAMSVAQASGVALLTAVEHGCGVAEYTAAEVKLAVTGYGNAPKEQVQAMVVRLLQLREVPRPADVADALALGICHLGATAWGRERATVKGLAG